MVNILDSVLNKEILLSIIRFGAGFALVLGIGSWIRAKKQIDYLTSSILILTAIFQFVDEFSLSMISQTWLRKSLFLIDIVALAASGTLVFLISTMSFKKYSKLPLIYYSNLLGPFILSLPIITFYEQEGSKELEFFLFAADLYVFVYFVIAIANVFIDKKYDSPTVNFRKILTFVILISLCIPLEILGIMFENKSLILLSSVHTTFTVIFYYFLTLIHPNLLDFFSLESGKNFVKRSLLHDVDITALEKKLVHIIKEERIYLDEDIRLPDVSEELGISVHQLSFFLNNHLGMNFNNYINRFRVEEAKSMLINDPSRSVVSVGIAVGFNSNSSFYKAFLKETGMSPKQFRETQTKVIHFQSSPSPTTDVPSETKLYL
ncbi:AraC family transcriptional regulator [Leptospira borgpetersenii]|uniref:AraC family transcriptional regulator n=1 Tax=Leptospira borgpetersenii TaxID=174 RepID=UPI0007745ECA|nr:helix-turn-helix domain-containing protein [Leptospira borgpetersenii]MBE8400876.1 AraC family transcriptional regulator [Leptospira borgpetersenii serovar Tarassovi]MBE8404624.1 AraC family transcriptional regulator [Leptospira borgpetersenii serovar Tarassovi]MBE8404961.1 AraC family transcriptional regulator [Leptospira borgpetersenii serovar Tarassovi]MBE8411343.1 AraC family transcriptional regulator [Leptospira borgpetersenii serovar Tarassovi]MBE8415297.1 AraC family transcriptional 